MSDRAAETLFQYGAVGVVLFVFLAVGVWFMKKVADRFMSYMDRNEVFMTETVKILASLTVKVENHGGVLAQVQEDITAISRLRKLSHSPTPPPPALPPPQGGRRG